PPHLGNGSRRAWSCQGRSPSREARSTIVVFSSQAAWTSATFSRSESRPLRRERRRTCSVRCSWARVWGTRKNETCPRRDLLETDSARRGQRVTGRLAHTGWNTTTGYVTAGSE